MAGRKKDSIWLYFDEEPIFSGRRVRVVCKLCGKNMVGIVSRMRKHKEYCTNPVDDLNTSDVSKNRSTKDDEISCQSSASSSSQHIKLQRRIDEKGQDSSDAREPKKSRKLNSGARKFEKVSRAKFDERGLDKETGLDLCDCLDDSCPGCWMECPKCGSKKCGHECRCLRRYKYEYVEIEGSSLSVRSKK